MKTKNERNRILMPLITWRQWQRSFRRKDHAVVTYRLYDWFESFLVNKLHLFWRCAYCNRLHFRNKIAVDRYHHMIDPFVSSNEDVVFCTRGSSVYDAITESILDYCTLDTPSYTEDGAVLDDDK